jgi:hypothetical protein
MMSSFQPPLWKEVLVPVNSMSPTARRTLLRYGRRILEMDVVCAMRRRMRERHWISTSQVRY